jgi:hypothetical protein
MHFRQSTEPRLPVAQVGSAITTVSRSVATNGPALRLPRQVIGLCLALFLGILPVAASAAATIGIEFADWGFDGRAAPRTFNLLTLGVQNLSDEPFEGTLRCRRLLSAAGAWSGAELLRDIYVGPNAIRMVQLYPYMLDEGEVWEVRWGDGLEEAFLTERPKLTGGSRIILNDPIANSGIKQGLKGFPEDWFPVTVVATDALRLAVMDHAPRWEATRRDVFRDWLFRGGILHVLHEPTGKYPEIPISDLNIDPRPTRFGAGRIYWHDRTRDELNKAYIYEKMYGTSQDLVAVVDRNGGSFDIDPTSIEFIRRDDEFFEAYAEWDSDRLIPARLKEFLRPSHEWPQIYLLAGVYLLMLFPGGYLLVRSKIDYRYSLLSLAVVVAGFSWLFSVMGARGYGESTSTTSVATARQLTDGRWDVEQWNSLFVKSGGDYSIRAAGDFPVISTVENLERVSGAVRNGRDGQFSVDMPPFTYRTFASRIDIALGTFVAKVVNAEYSDQQPADDRPFDSSGDSLDEPLKTLESLRVEIDGVLPSKIRDAVILFGGSLYPVNVDVLRAGSGNLVEGPGVRLVERIDLSRQFRRYLRGQMETPDAALNQFTRWLIARDLRLRRRSDIADLKLPADEARLYVHADLPSQLVCQNAADPDAPFGNNSGRIVYRIDLQIPQSSTP